ncbi:MAG: TraR/DksA C4-type zinc finger protein [Planctomycetes bacterium]|nr:TraR/DksA C4-type zinc finger protein [Planctomycetota bacterium]
MAKKVKKATKKKSATKKSASKKAKTKKAAVKKKTKKTTKKAAKKVTKKKVTKKKVTKKKTTKKAVKKTTKKRSVARSKVVARPKRKVPKKRTEKRLSAEEIETFKDMLLEKRRELIGDVNAIENEALKKSRLDASGDLSSMPIHMADIGSDNFEQEFMLGLMDGERRILSEINGALKRIIDGTYGICQGTGDVIARPRLRAKPWARYCIEYATMVEKGLVIEGEKLYDEPEAEEAGVGESETIDDNKEYADHD